MSPYAGVVLQAQLTGSGYAPPYTPHRAAGH